MAVCHPFILSWHWCLTKLVDKLDMMDVTREVAGEKRDLALGILCNEWEKSILLASYVEVNSTLHYNWIHGLGLWNSLSVQPRLSFPHMPLFRYHRVTYIVYLKSQGLAQENLSLLMPIPARECGLLSMTFLTWQSNARNYSQHSAAVMMHNELSG